MKSRPTRCDCTLALLAPTVGWLTFPNQFGRPNNWLYSPIGRLVPHYEWTALPTSCMGAPYGPPELVRTELLFGLAEDLFVFTVAMFAVYVLGAVAIGSSIVRRRDVPRLAMWTTLTTLLSVLAWAELWYCGLTMP